MAAHILTALEPLSKRENWDTNAPEQTLVGLSFARFGDLLDIKDWEVLRAILACPDKDIAYAAYMAFWYGKLCDGPYFQLWAEWDKLGQPETVEKWLDLKYGGGK